MSLGVEDRMFLGSCWNMECGEGEVVLDVVEVLTLGEERSMA